MAKTTRNDDEVNAYERLRSRHVADMEAQVPGHVARLAWTPGQIRRERAARLQTLLREAFQRSPWHRQRLEGVDLSRITPTDLSALPVMTKADLMAHFDEIVTDPRLDLDLVESHLRDLVADNYLLDRYHVIASGGSSGLRGVFIYDWEGWITFHLSAVRRTIAEQRDQRARSPEVIAMVTADRASHASVARSQTFASATTQVHHLSVSLPLDRLVAGLNELQPTTLMGYPSALRWLADAAEHRRLQIRPRRVRCVGEPLFPEIRASLVGAFNAPVQDVWAASEAGTLAESCTSGSGLHLNEDLTIIEPVDERRNPAPLGHRAAKILLTNLFNLALPLICYEMTDQVVVAAHPCQCGSSYRLLETVEGRLDDIFVYGAGVSIHPFVFRSVLGREAAVSEYQVRQTHHGASISLCTTSSIDLEWLAQQLSDRLIGAGLHEPDVTLQVVARLDRTSTGKFRRFIPLE